VELAGQQLNGWAASVAEGAGTPLAAAALVPEGAGRLLGDAEAQVTRRIERLCGAGEGGGSAGG
jgi:hypothetical protein